MGGQKSVADLVEIVLQRVITRLTADVQTDDLADRLLFLPLPEQRGIDDCNDLIQCIKDGVQRLGQFL